MKRSHIFITVALAGLPTLLLAQAPVASAQSDTTTKSKSSIQQQFDDGTAAINAGDWQRAYDIYTALEKTISARTPPSKSLGIVRLRKGLMMIKLDRAVEGEAALNSALAAISSADPGMADERADALFILGQLAEKRYDYPGAVGYFRSALQSSNDAAVKLSIFSRLIPLGIFVDRDSALVDADAALALVAQHPEANKEWPGTLRALRGRVLMNMRRLKEARADLNTSIKQLGGLGTNKINLLDATARSDAAIAALLDSSPQEARRYLAYAGSTQQADQGFKIGRDMNPPACGGRNGPRPEDVAVIEFNIRDDGSIGVARPIYYSGELAGAVEFAKAVSDWSWNPEELKEVSPFYRALTRVELRCTSVFAKPNQFSLLAPAVNAWLKILSVDDYRENASNQSTSLQNMQKDLVQLESQFGLNSIKLIPILTELSFNPVLSSDIRKIYAQRAYDMAISANSPAQPRAFFGLNLWRFVDNNIKGNARDPYHVKLSQALADPIIASDVTASAAIRLAFFDTLSAKNRLVEGVPILQPIVDNVSMPASDPFKVGVLTRLASLQYSQGKVDDARELFSKTGLSAQQCALVDAQPVKNSGRLTSADYPEGGYEYGFGGWAVVEFDIDAAGTTANQRPVIAWPPFVFGESVAKGIKRFRYQQSYRPDGGLGCSGQRHYQSFRFDRGG
jgi:tetratricopeptide (TPR) repeat protein